MTKPKTTIDEVQSIVDTLETKLETLRRLAPAAAKDKSPTDDPIVLTWRAAIGRLDNAYEVADDVAATLEFMEVDSAGEA